MAELMDDLGQLGQLRQRRGRLGLVEYIQETRKSFESVKMVGSHFVDHGQDSIGETAAKEVRLGLVHSALALRRLELVKGRAHLLKEDQGQPARRIAPRKDFDPLEFFLAPVRVGGGASVIGHGRSP
jgi:hypothetical protein